MRQRRHARVGRSAGLCRGAGPSATEVKRRHADPGSNGKPASDHRIREVRCDRVLRLYFTSWYTLKPPRLPCQGPAHSPLRRRSARASKKGTPRSPAPHPAPRDPQASFPGAAVVSGQQPCACGRLRLLDPGIVTYLADRLSVRSLAPAAADGAVAPGTLLPLDTLLKQS